MNMNHAEAISLKSFINAYFRENNRVRFEKYNSQIVARYALQPFGFEICIPVEYQSLSGRHQFTWPAFMLTKGGEEVHFVHPWCLVGLLIQDLSHHYPEATTGHREFLQRFFNSCENLSVILKHWSFDKIETLFSESVDFQLAENGLLAGHQLHPVPKSREGFTTDEFKRYSPELQNMFKLHYLIADESIVFTDSALAHDANSLVRNHFLKDHLNDAGIVIPLHPWQMSYIQNLPIIQQWFSKGLLKDLGSLGESFTATSSVRTVYSPKVPYMIKLSLNISITNSIRTQYSKELVRGVAAHRFWESSIGKKIQTQFPQFSPITDPAFLCLRDGDNMIDETASLLRVNPFKVSNNVTSLASLCQDHPFEIKNRLNTLISLVAKKKNISNEQAALLWFNRFLEVAIEPLLWMFVHYGVAVEAHQQNLLIQLHNGLPIRSYYRDNQGYYVTDESIALLENQMDSKILDAFCKGTVTFIQHHFIYYLICNSTLGVINALGTSGIVPEGLLLLGLNNFIYERAQLWNINSSLLKTLLEADTLPFKGNLLTRFHELDELIAPLENQSVYINIDNPIKMSKVS